MLPLSCFYLLGFHHLFSQKEMHHYFPQLCYPTSCKTSLSQSNLWLNKTKQKTLDPPSHNLQCHKYCSPMTKGIHPCLWPISRKTCHRCLLNFLNCRFSVQQQKWEDIMNIPKAKYFIIGSSTNLANSKQCMPKLL